MGGCAELGIFRILNDFAKHGILTYWLKVPIQSLQEISATIDAPMLLPHGSWAVERSVVGIDENGQIMRQGDSLDVGSSLWMNEFSVVCFVLLWEKPSLNT